MKNFKFYFIFFIIYEYKLKIITELFFFLNYIIVHEYLHLVLIDNLGQRQGSLLSFLEAYSKQIALKDEMLGVLAQVLKPDDMKEGSVLQKRVVEITGLISKETVKVEKALMELNLNHDAFKAMEELFADLGAVLISDNRNAMKEAIEANSHKKAADKGKYRTFADGLTLEKLNLWDPHDALYQTRGFLGEVIYKNKYSKPKILMATFNSILEHTVNPKYKDQEWNPIMLNNDLIESIQKELDK